MKVLYFISAHGHGRGGHFHSLNHISRKFGENNQVNIVSIGPGCSDILKKNPYFRTHLFFNGLNYFDIKKKITDLISEVCPDIYHFFDEGSFNIVRLFLSTNKHNIVVSKCGGPNPRFYPRVPNLVLFSRENLEWFRSKKQYQDTRIFLIPNRVHSIELSDGNFDIKKDLSSFNFLRICRIGHDYKKSIGNSISLIQKLIQSGQSNVKLFIIGVVEDQKTYNDFMSHQLVKKNAVTFLTDPIYTKEASKLLYLSDAVIGTGRGLMEAASLGKPILVINSQEDIPVLLDEDNFLAAFSTNFSERNVFDRKCLKNNFANTQMLIKSDAFYIDKAIFSKQMFNKYFDVDRVNEKYADAYSSVSKGKRVIFSDSLIICRSFVNFFRSYLKGKRYQ